MGFVIIVLYLILCVICYYIVSFNDDHSPTGEFVEEQRTVIKKKALHEKPTDRELSQRTTDRRVSVHEAGWKLNFGLPLLLIPLSFIPGMGSLMIRRRLCNLDVPSEEHGRRLAAQKPGQISWMTLILQCLTLG